MNEAVMTAPEQMITKRLQQRMQRQRPIWEKALEGMEFEHNNVRDAIVSPYRTMFYAEPPLLDAPIDNPLPIIQFGLRTPEGFPKGFGFDNQKDPLTMHVNAIEQLAGKLKIPTRFARDLAKGPDWQRGEFTQLFNTFLTNAPQTDRYMVRAFEGRAKAIMSDRYKPMNNGYVFASVLRQARQFNAEAYDGHHGDLTGFLEIVHPELVPVVTPNNGTVHMIFGVQMRSSDYGAGALVVHNFLIQGICGNGAVIEMTDRKVHIGARMEEDADLREVTKRKVLDATVAMLIDKVSARLHPNNVREQAQLIMRSSAKLLTAEQTDTILVERLERPEQESVKALLYGSDMPNLGVVGSLSHWKIAQAISAIVPSDDADRRRELQKVAGDLIKQN